MYQAPDAQAWQGRIDNGRNPHTLRWHQIVQTYDLAQEAVPEDIKHVTYPIALLGFVSDEGVRRNHGRVGAAEGPAAIRKALCNHAVHFVPQEVCLVDCGNVVCEGEQMEPAQTELGRYVAQLLRQGCYPIVLGGGHEVAWGHYIGLRDYLGHGPPVLNFDAHFDLRPIRELPSSGTPFEQMARECEEERCPFIYKVLGINRQSNTSELFQRAEEIGAEYTLASDMNSWHLWRLQSELSRFLARNEPHYLSIDLDGFAAAYAPGVSDVNPTGFTPEITLELLRQVWASGKVLSMDIAELNPSLDQDNRTAKLAAALIYEYVASLSS
jgi:formiminoglutamase